MKEDESKPWQSTLQDFGRALHETTFVVIDLETTGGAPHLGAAITEIGAIKSRGGEVLGEFKTFVDPGHLVPVYITELTGITDEMLFDSDDFIASTAWRVASVLVPEDQKIELVNKLITQLGRGDSDVQFGLTRFLCALGECIIEPLTGASNSEDETISNQAKFTLLRFKEMQLESAKPAGNSGKKGRQGQN